MEALINFDHTDFNKVTINGSISFYIKWATDWINETNNVSDELKRLCYRAYDACKNKPVTWTIPVDISDVALAEASHLANPFSHTITESDLAGWFCEQRFGKEARDKGRIPTFKKMDRTGDWRIGYDDEYKDYYGRPHYCSAHIYTSRDLLIAKYNLYEPKIRDIPFTKLGFDHFK